MATQRVPDRYYITRPDLEVAARGERGTEVIVRARALLRGGGPRARRRGQHFPVVLHQPDLAVSVAVAAGGGLGGVGVELGVRLGLGVRERGRRAQARLRRRGRAQRARGGKLLSGKKG